MRRRSKPDLGIFNVTIACLYMKHKHLLRKEWNADIKNKLSSLLPKSSVDLQSLFFHTLFKDWVVVWGVFIKLRFVERSKTFGNRCSSHFRVSGWNFFYPWCLNNKIQSTGKKFNLVSFQSHALYQKKRLQTICKWWPCHCPQHLQKITSFCLR